MTNTIKRRLIQLLDRPGGRMLLSAFANHYARHCGSSVMWDQVWAHRTGDSIFVDSSYFDYYKDSFSSWPSMDRHLQQEVEDFWFYAYRPKLGDIIVDVGAGRGEHLLPMCRAVGASGRVIAVEAHPESFRCLQAACRLNGLKQVKALHVAITDKIGRVAISTGEDWLKNTVLSKGNYDVQGITLDSLIVSEGLTRVDFLKMNIEGAETLALAGLNKFTSFVLNLNISCHDFRAERGDGELYRTKKKVADMLKLRGFQTVSREDPRPFIRDQIIASITKYSV